MKVHAERHISIKASELVTEIDTNGFHSGLVSRIHALLTRIKSPPASCEVTKLLAHKDVRCYRNMNGYSILHQAIRSENPHSVKALLDSGHSIETLAPYKNSALHLALRTNNLSLVKTILPYCSSKLLRLENQNGQYPLLQCIHDSRLTRLLLDHTKSLNELVPKKKISVYFQKVFRNQTYRTIKHVLNNTHNISKIRDEWGRTPLYWAKRYDIQPIIKKLHTLGLKDAFSLTFSKECREQAVCLFAARHKQKLVKDTSLYTKPGYINATLPILSKLWSEYIDNSKHLPFDRMFCDKITQSLFLAGLEPDPKKFLEHYKEHNQVLINTGWQGHIITLAVSGKLLFICNRGEESTHQQSNVEVFEINPDMLTEDVLDRINVSIFKKLHNAEKYIYNRLLSDLDAKKTSFCRSIESQIHLTNQKHANCAAANPKAGIFSLLVSVYQNQTTLGADEAQQTKEFYNGFKVYSRDRIVELSK